MKTDLKNSLSIIVLLALAGCLRNNMRTETFQIEQLRSTESVQQVEKALRTLTGIDDVKTNLAEGTLTLVYNARVLHLKNIEAVLVKAGFDLPNHPAAAKDKEKLPEELR